MEYLILVLLFLFLMYRYDYRQATSGRNTWLIIMAVLLILFGGLRYRIGGDTLAYMHFYERMHDLGHLTMRDIENSRFAPGFLIVASFCKLFTKEIVLLQLVEAGAICGTATWFFNKNTRHPFFALFLFFIMMYQFLVFEQLREGFAVAVFLLAWPSFLKRNWIVWYLLCFLAISFHASAMIMFVLPAVLLPVIRQLFVYGRRTWILCLIIGVTGYFIQSYFFYYLELVSVTDSMADFASRYTGTVWSGGMLNIVGITAFLIRYVGYPIYAMWLFKKQGERGDDYKLKNVETMAIISLYVSVLSISISIMLRYDNYFFFFAILLMSDLIFDKIRLMGKYLRLRYVTWLIFFMPLFILQFDSYNSKLNKSGTLRTYMAYYPYNSFIDKQKDENRERAFIYMSRRIHDMR